MNSSGKEGKIELKEYEDDLGDFKSLVTTKPFVLGGYSC